MENGDDGDNSNKNGDRADSLTYYTTDQFVMGADLSYANQILDHRGTFIDSGEVETPYEIFWEHGTNAVRLRLWHTPDWVRNEVYHDSTKPLYSGLAEVTKSIKHIKRWNMEVMLDFHYSDTWADPGKQHVPDAWRNITRLEVLKDSVYNYTKRVLQHLENRGLMPEMLQIGNEINCGMLYSRAPDQFPQLNVCETGNWQKLGEVINSGIQAVRTVESESSINTKIILHIAQPEHVSWWFDNITGKGNVNNFDMIGFSYYSPWSEVSIDKISDYVNRFRNTYEKQVMIVETAYPWTMNYADSYNNIFGKNSLINGYPATVKGQRSYMTELTTEVIDGRGQGIFYWEPDWITSNMKTQWGTGSAWENNAFFDFEGNLHRGIKYMTYPHYFE